MDIRVDSRDGRSAACRLGYDDPGGAPQPSRSHLRPVDRLLQVKLVEPHPRRLVSRPRLIELLDRALEVRLALLSAPPGFGKTSALVDWLARRDIRSAWVSLDPGDNDAVRFVRYLWAAAGSLARDGEEPFDGMSSGDTAEAIDELAAQLDGLPGPSVLVLDDYHAVEAPAVQAAVSRLIDRLPASVHLVVATRADPVSLPLARLRARDDLLEIRADALRFTLQETRRYVAERAGIELGEDDLETLVARTEGWPAVLQLAAMSLFGRDDVSGFIHDFAASHRHVLDFISEEVLACLELDEREFLFQTSVLDRLSGELCNALTGRTDGQAMLERLEHRNVLLVPLDEERSWYRYHHLFAELLRARLAAQDPGAPRRLNLSAADWFEQHGLTIEAIEHALRSGDHDFAAPLIARSSAELIHTGQYASLLRCLDRLPDAAVRSDVVLSSRYAWGLVLSGRTDGVETRLVDAEAALPAALAAGNPVAERIPSHLALIRCVVARLEHDPLTAIAHAERALRLSPPPDSLLNEALVADVRGQLGLALEEAGKLDRAAEAFEAVRPVEERAGNWIAVADMTGHLARLEARRNRSRAALEACDHALRTFGGNGSRELPAAAAIHLARAEILERLADAGAAEAAEHALALSRRGGDAVTAREARALIERVRGGRSPAVAEQKLVEPLTARELEVLQLVATGRSNRQIADELFLAVGTVKTRIHRIVGKLGAENRMEAVARARALSLL